MGGFSWPAEYALNKFGGSGDVSLYSLDKELHSAGFRQNATTTLETILWEAYWCDRHEKLVGVTGRQDRPTVIRRSGRRKGGAVDCHVFVYGAAKALKRLITVKIVA